MKGSGRNQNFAAKDMKVRRQHAPDEGKKTHKGGRTFPFVRCSICKQQVTRRGFVAHNYIAHDRMADAEEVVKW